MNDAKSATIVELDVPSVGVAIDLVKKLTPHVGGFSISVKLLTAMLLLLVEPMFSKEVPDPCAKIRRLFSLLGYDVLKVLCFVLETNEDRCRNIIFTNQKIILVGENGKQLTGMNQNGKTVEVGADLYISSKTEIVQASDPIEAAKQAVAENEVEMIKNAHFNGEPDPK